MKFNFDNDLLVEEDLVLKEDSLDQCRSDANSICKMLDRSNIWYELVDYDMYPMNTSKISFEVSGDWKHDHWVFKDILNDWAEENNRDIFKIDEEEIGESDSDDYVARYDVFITADKDSYNKLNSMRGLFAEGLNPREKQIYVDAVNEAEDIEDLEDICHEIYFYDKRLFAQINKKPKDGDVEKMRANMLKYLQESIKESKMFGSNYRYDIVWYNKEGKRINFGFTNDINDAENIAIRACKHIYGMSPSNDRVQFLDSLDIEDTDNKNSSAITSRVVDVKEKFLSKLENKNESLDESRALNYVVEPHKIDMDVYDIVFRKDHPHAGERAHSKRFTSYDDALKFIKRNAKYNNWDASPMNEDTIKTKDGKWTNKGEEGTHGKFKTKKEADAQRKAMFANGFKENLKESIYDWPVVIDDTRIQLPITENELIYFIETNLLNSKYNVDFIGEVKLVTSGVDEANRKYYNIEVSGFLRQKNKMFKVPVRVWENGDIEDSRNPLPPVENVIDESAVWVDGNGKEIQRPMSSFGEPDVDYSLISKQAKDYKEKQNIIRNLIQTYDQVKIQGMSPIVALIRDNVGNTIYRFDFLEKNKNFEDQIAEFKSLVGKGLKESYYKLCGYDSDPETGLYGDKFDCYAVVKAFDAKDAQEKFKDILLRTGDEQDRDRIRYFKNFTDYLQDSEMYIDDATEEEFNEYKDYQDARFESLEEDLDDDLKKLLNDYFRHSLAGNQTWADVENIDKIDDNTYKVDVRFKEEFRYDVKDTDGIPYTEYEDSETYTTYKVRIENGKIVSVSNMMNESLKEDFSDFNLINYNDFLANNFDGWSDDIDDLMKEISKCARALKTVSNKLIFYVDYDEDFYAVDNIAKVVEYIGYDYSLYQLNDLSGIYFVFGSDNLWIFRNEKEANYVISKVKATAKEMNESLQAKLDEGLLDSLEDFKEARKNWEKVVKDISFDVALERWNKESDLADPDWFAKPIYSVKAWDDMVNMFSNQDDLEEAPIEEDFDYDPDKLPDLDDIDKMEWKVDEEDGSEYIKIDEINKSVYVALGDNGYYTFLYDGNSNSITPLDDYVDSEEDAKASAKEFLKDYVEGFY